MTTFRIKQNRLTKLHAPNGCAYHTNEEGEVFDHDSILPHGICPWLYHSVYPYFLGLLYGAKFDWNEYGDCNVCCPALEGVDTIVKLRDNDGSFDPRISPDVKFVIFAEIVAVRGHCPYDHKVGQRFPFPTCMKEHYLCPAAFNNVFPLMELEPPSCIDHSNLRCPDWLDSRVITFDVSKDAVD